MGVLLARDHFPVGAVFSDLPHQLSPGAGFVRNPADWKQRVQSESWQCYNTAVGKPRWSSAATAERKVSILGCRVAEQLGLVTATLALIHWRNKAPRRRLAAASGAARGACSFLVDHGMIRALFCEGGTAALRKGSEVVKETKSTIRMGPRVVTSAGCWMPSLGMIWQANPRLPCRTIQLALASA